MPGRAHQAFGGIVGDVLALQHVVLVVDQTDVPEFRHNPIAARVDLPCYFGPARQRRLAVKAQQQRIVASGRVIDEHPLGQDEACATYGASAVVGGHVKSRYPIVCGMEAHRRHDDPIAQRTLPMRNGWKRGSMEAAVRLTMFHSPDCISENHSSPPQTMHFSHHPASITLPDILQWRREGRPGIL